MSSESDISFAQLALSPSVLQAVSEMGYEAPSPIQAQSIPPLLAGRDLLGQAQTGTGKTAAFALPLLSRLDLDHPAPQVLVLTPTRELAIQVAEAMQGYARHLPGFHVLPVYGGQSMGIQLRHLRRGAQVVVGTPGRLIDHLNRGSLDLSELSAVVLDEADEMLKMGFIDDVENILGHTPAERQIALFSATLPAPIRAIARRHMREPVTIQIASKTTTVASVRQRYWQVAGLDKLDALTRILEVEDFEAMIVFVRTKTASTELAEKLEARGYASAPLNGDMNQQLRERTIERLKNGQLEIVVATDVAARGLDVERISHVLNYDIPHDTEAYVHRIGRTGRAGRKGEAILFVSARERRMLRAIEKATRQPIEPMGLPSREAITDRRVTQFRQQLGEALAGEELGFFRELVDSYRTDTDAAMEDIAAALAYLVQRERPLVPDIRDIPEPSPPRKHRESRREPRDNTGPQPGTTSYRLEVGREHGVEPKHIVGAIANEAGIDGRQIGAIRLHDSYSTVDLPDGMPPALFRHLQKVRVCGRPMQLRPLTTPTSHKTARPGA